MKQPKTFLLLSVIVAVLILGVAYASISNLTFDITGNATATTNEANFDVHFATATQTTPIASGEGMVTYGASGRTATFNVTELKNVGDTASVTFTIENDSQDIAAKITNINFTGASNDFMTAKYEGIKEGDVIAAKGSTTVTISVTLNKATAVDVKLETISLTFEAAAVNS